MHTTARKLATAAFITIAINANVMANSPYKSPYIYLDTDHQIDAPDTAPVSSNENISSHLGNEGISHPFAEFSRQSSTFDPWFTEHRISGNAKFLINTIEDARSHGLDPEQYDLSRILLISETLQKRTSCLKSESLGTTDDNLRYNLSYLLDTNFVKVIEHLGQGVVDGPSLQRRLFRDRPDIDAFNMLVSVNNAELSVKQAITRATPMHSDYERLREKMRDLLTEQSTYVERIKVNEHVQTILVTEASDKQLISQRLVETGDLTFEAFGSSDPDERLLQALQAFQGNHGLKPNGLVDEATRNALNASVEEDIEAVAVSLERWRWLPRDLGDRHLIANIPGYSVKFVENDTTMLSMRTVVGKIRHQTPSFTEDMTYMEFNPTWTVPSSITNNELLPIERRKPGYLTARNFDVIRKQDDGWRRDPISSLTQAELNASPFPYTLRQRGGAGNALGRMKFMMPNPYSIYLHDTPAKSYFSHTDRAYSHGCIRLSDPDAMAQHLLMADGYTPDEIKTFSSSTKNRRVNFRTPVPTHMVYMTTWVGENNVLQKRPDVYGNDGALLAALRDGGTLLSNDMKLAQYTY